MDTLCFAAYAEIGHIANAIGVSGGDSIVHPALAFYTVSFFNVISIVGIFVVVYEMINSLNSCAFVDST